MDRPRKFPSTFQELKQQIQEYFEWYPRDEYFVEELLERHDGWDLESAISQVQSQQFLADTLAYCGLEYILADKHATLALKKALVRRDEKIIKALRIAARRRISQGGRPPILREGKAMGKRIVEITRKDPNLAPEVIAAMVGSTNPKSVETQQNRARKKGDLPASVRRRTYRRVPNKP